MGNLPVSTCLTHIHTHTHTHTHTQMWQMYKGSNSDLFTLLRMKRSELGHVGVCLCMCVCVCGGRLLLCGSFLSCLILVDPLWFLPPTQDFLWRTSCPGNTVEAICSQPHTHRLHAHAHTHTHTHTHTHRPHAHTHTNTTHTHKHTLHAHKQPQPQPQPSPVLQ